VIDFLSLSFQFGQAGRGSRLARGSIVVICDWFLRGCLRLTQRGTLAYAGYRQGKSQTELQVTQQNRAQGGFLRGSEGFAVLKVEANSVGRHVARELGSLPWGRQASTAYPL
jgi:hypothetical protein